MTVDIGAPRAEALAVALHRGVELGELDARAEALRSEGQTVMFVAVGDEAAGLVGVAAPVKESTPEAIEALHREGIRIVMLTGDSRTTADAVAKKLGLGEGIAEVLPDQRVEVVKRFQSEGRFVAMAATASTTPRRSRRRRSESRWAPGPTSRWRARP